MACEEIAVEFEDVRMLDMAPDACRVLQGRLESLLNFQTMVADLTGMEMSQSSLLDEATAAAEAMTMTSAMAKGKKLRFIVAANCHPQTIEVCRSRADGLGLTVDVVPADKIEFAPDVCGALVQVCPPRWSPAPTHPTTAQVPGTIGCLHIGFHRVLRSLPPPLRAADLWHSRTRCGP